MGTLKDLRAFEIDIVSLKNGKDYPFEFNVDDSFFAYFATDLVQKGACVAKVTINRGTSMLTASFHLSGTVELVCDRSLEPFDHPIEHEHVMYFKLGDQDGDDSDDVVVISRASQALNVGKYIFEFIGLEIPFRKIHPKFAQAEAEQAEGELVYSSGLPPEADDEPTHEFGTDGGTLEDGLAQLKEKFKNRNK
jgi:uncharacterized metal-binding protein YceD (DUF177 family)